VSAVIVFTAVDGRQSAVHRQRSAVVSDTFLSIPYDIRTRQDFVVPAKKKAED
jgi:hypothetical protein